MSIHVLHAPSFTLPVRRTRRASAPTRKIPTPKTSTPTPTLRLTRRGRLVLLGLPVLLATAVLLALVAVLTTAPAAAEQGVRAVPSTPAMQVTVQPGESLWQVAAANAHGRDTRDVLAQIVVLNGLDGDRIDAGRKLYVPLGS